MRISSPFFDWNTVYKVAKVSSRNEYELKKNKLFAMKEIYKPSKEEYPAYAEMYMKWIPDDGQLLKHLKKNFQEIKNLIYSLRADKLYYRYAQKKWTIKEILVHIVDDERIYAYRALCFARGDQTSLPGFEQDDYAKYSGANERELDNIFEEYESVRNATIALFNGLTDDAFLRKGEANNNKATVRAMAYHIAGHEMHHLNVIKERYLK